MGRGSSGWGEGPQKASSPGLLSRLLCSAFTIAMMWWLLGPTQMLLVETTYVVGVTYWVDKLCAPWNVNQKQKGRKRGKGGMIPMLVAITSHEKLLRTLSGACRCKAITTWEQQNNSMRPTAWEKQGRYTAPGALGNIAKAARVGEHCSGRQVWNCRWKALSNTEGQVPEVWVQQPRTHCWCLLCPFVSHSLTLSWWKVQ